MQWSRSRVRVCQLCAFDAVGMYTLRLSREGGVVLLYRRSTGMWLRGREHDFFSHRRRRQLKERHGDKNNPPACASSSHQKKYCFIILDWLTR